MQTGSLVNFSGHQYLRQRLVLSILSGKHVRIEKIRSEDKNPGLRGMSSYLRPEYFLTSSLTQTTKLAS
jgi:RNA 3'-terminal phosphate cyclase